MKEKVFKKYARFMRKIRQNKFWKITDKITHNSALKFGTKTDKDDEFTWKFILND
jgi:hypothetical protein